MPKVATDVCSAAVVIYCKITKQSISVAWVEKTNHKSADNYNAEILGGIAAQLITKAVLTNHQVHPSIQPRIGCDNLGVVKYGTHPSAHSMNARLR